MRSTIRLFAFGLATAALAPAQENFSQRLTSEERRAAGLDRLTAEQLAALDALVARDRARPAAPAVPAAQPAPAPKPVASVVADTAPADQAPAKKTRRFGLPQREEETAITGTLAGEFRGWNGTTVFRFEDGQVWVQEDRNDMRELAPRQSPRVKITKSMFGGYKLTVEGDLAWVRVRRVQ